MIERMSVKQSLIRKKIAFPNYLKNLSKILGLPVSEENLGTPDEAKKLRAES